MRNISSGLTRRRDDATRGRPMRMGGAYAMVIARRWVEQRENVRQLRQDLRDAVRFQDVCQVKAAESARPSLSLVARQFNASAFRARLWSKASLRCRFCSWSAVGSCRNRECRGKRASLE